MSSGQTRRIVFFGTEDFSLGALQSLVEGGFDVVLVVTKPDTPQGRGHKMTPPKVKVYAESNGIRVVQPLKLADIKEDITALNKPVGVLVSYGKIIPQSLIDLFNPGIINVHPSLLPKYRGPSPIESAILNDDSETGVSIMQLSARMDAGPVYGYTPLTLRGNETRNELYERLGEIGSQTLIRLLPLIVGGEASGLEQDEAEATYCQLITKADGIIDWTKPADRIEREIRAYAGWPQSRTTLNGIDVIITAAETHDDFESLGPGEPRLIPMNKLWIGTGKGYLVPTMIKPLGKKEMPIAAFLSGYRSQLGL